MVFCKNYGAPAFLQGVRLTSSHHCIFMLISYLLSNVPPPPIFHLQLNISIRVLDNVVTMIIDNSEMVGENGIHTVQHHRQGSRLTKHIQ